MDEDNDVFQDFDSDASDFDDDVDLDFTDGESASVLQLMGGADSIKKTNSGGLTATSLPTVVYDTETPSNTVKKNVVGASKVSTFSDEELLGELFPNPKTRISTNLGEPTDEAHTFSKECEVDWTEDLREHDHHGRPPANDAKGGTDFLTLFEEMYGDNTAISLSTPSPTKRDGDRHNMLNATQSDEKQVADISDVISSSTVPERLDDLLPAEIRYMLQKVYTTAKETHWDLSTQFSETFSTLCLPDHTNVGPVDSWDSLVKATCSLDESLKDRDFINSLASTRQERLELIVAVLDNKINALPPYTKTKWMKIIDTLPRLVKMRKQTKSLVPTPSPATKQSVFHIKTQPEKPKDKSSPLEGWATFHPEKMPARRCETMKITTSRTKQGGGGTIASSKKPRVRIREYIPAKLRVRCKVYNPEDSELTFQPKINKKRLHHRNGVEQSFAARMERDISLRRLQKLQQDQRRQQHEQEEAENVAVNLVAKGSQRILLKNGMWTETLEERLQRLAKHRTNVEASDSRSKKRRQRLEQRKRQTAAIASRACESLYQRGIEQRRREEERLHEDTLDLEFERNRPKISNRSVRVMKTRIRQELAQLCLDSQHTANTDIPHEDESMHNSSSTVTFVQFSCALIYFGFVVNLNTPWEGSVSENRDNEITLLWHSWTVFTRDESGTRGSKLSMKMLERILFSVILGGSAGDHPVFRYRDVQVLLRLYRANYYARKHTQLEEEPSREHIQNTKEKRVISHRQRVRYTMHGKPIRNNEAPETDLLSEREHLRREKLEQMREVKAKQELEGCTFHPRINPRPVHAAPPKSTASNDTMSTFERLYSDAFQRQHNVFEKYLEAKLHREELEKRESRIQPSYVNGLTVEERLENLHVALAGNALPVNFHKKIDAMRSATEMKALNEQIKEQRLQPPRFKKAKDGSTIVLPFQFATEIRAALNTTDTKTQRTNIANRPRDHVMKGLRPFDVKREREELPQPMVRRHRGKRAELCLDVHLSPSETHQLYLNVDDDPFEAVERFAQRFSLTSTQRHFLAQLVETRLEQFATY